MSKKGDRVPLPARKGDWQPRFGTKEAAVGWEELCRTAPNATHAAYVTICQAPDRAADHEYRQKYQLIGELGTVEHQYKTYPQWQYKVTSGGRIWYGIDKERRTLWFMKASPRHPKETE